MNGPGDDEPVPIDLPRWGDQPEEDPEWEDEPEVLDSEFDDAAKTPEQALKEAEALQEAQKDLLDPKTDLPMLPRRTAKAGRDVEEAARDALADVIAEPITDLVMLGARLFESGSENAVVGEEIDQLSEFLLLFADPARLPSEIADKVVAHLTAHLLASTLGPVCPVVVMFAGKFAGNLTRQALDGNREPDIQRTESAIEVAGAFTDSQLGRLAESEPFRDYISDLLGGKVAEILPGEGWTPTATAVVAVYEVRSPVGDPTVVRIRPASFAVWTCVPDTAVVKRWKSGRFMYLQLTDGTIIEISPGGTAVRLRLPD